MQCNPDVEYVLHIKDDEHGLLDDSDKMLDKLWPSVCPNVRLSLRSAFDDVKTTFASGGIEAPTDSCGVLSLTHQGLQATVHLQFSDTARVAKKKRVRLCHMLRP